MNKPQFAIDVIGTRVPDAGATPAKMPEGWIDADRVAKLFRVSLATAQRYLAAWEADALAGKSAPRTQRWRSGARGRPPLLVLDADARALLGLDDVAQAA